MASTPLGVSTPPKPPGFGIPFVPIAIIRTKIQTSKHRDCRWQHVCFVLLCYAQPNIPSVFLNTRPIILTRLSFQSRLFLLFLCLFPSFLNVLTDIRIHSLMPSRTFIPQCHDWHSQANSGAIAPSLPSSHFVQVPCTGSRQPKSKKEPTNGLNEL